MALSSTFSALMTNPVPTVTPTEATPTTEDPLQRHLSAIIGVPVGLGLSLLVLGLCALWLFLSSYIRYHREEREQGTNTTHLNSSKGGTAGKQERVSEHSSNGGGASSPPPTSHHSPHSPTSPNSPKSQITDTKV